MTGVPPVALRPIHTYRTFQAASVPRRVRAALVLATLLLSGADLQLTAQTGEAGVRLRPRCSADLRLELRFWTESRAFSA